MKNKLYNTILLIFLISQVSNVMSQESGALDSTFNFDGICTFNNGGDHFLDITIQTDGKILVMSNNDLYSDSVLIARFNPDGELDTTFGNDGSIQTPGSGISLYSDGHKLISLPDGSIYAGCNTAIGAQNFTIAKFTSDGSPDSSFDLDGILYESLGTSNSWFQDFVVQPDGKIIVSGFVKIEFNPFLWTFGPAICRYLPDGSPDEDFGVDGKLLLGDLLPDECPKSLLLTPEGKIIVMTTNLILQLLPNGEFDESFGSEGIITVENDYPFGYRNSTICRNDDGTIFIAGIIDWGETSELFLYKYSVNGERDLLFGFGGEVHQNYNPTNIPNALELQADGKLLLLTTSWSIDGISSYLFLTRYYQNGVQDTVLGDNGYFDVSPGWQSWLEVGTDLAIQPDNAILICGYLEDDTINEGRIWRLLPELEFTSLDDQIITQNCYIFPNPTSDLCYLKTNFYLDENYPLSLVDQQGRFIKTLIPVMENDIQEKTYRIQLPDNLPSGTYFITFQSRSQKFSVQFVTK